MRRVTSSARGQYARRASTADEYAAAGSAAVILLLLLAFVLLYRRSVSARCAAERLTAITERLARDNAHLAAASSDEARTDALTGLRNRRALSDDLAGAVHPEGGDRELLLALVDLDGFKQYNDTFGHPAGDSLLSRLGARLMAATSGLATAYRIGGDEFCILASVADRNATVVTLAAQALAETGDAFTISCSYGAVFVPSEAATADDALGLADQRTSGHKAPGRMSASRQSSDVLLKVLSERSVELREHLSGVAELATQTAERLGLPEKDVELIGLAAELHDIGKTAIPDQILHKPGPLDAHEWEFMRRHTIIGERILLAAPALAPTAELVRSSHERFDGTGYPDALSGAEIPIGSGIITVCDAFDAMTTERTYSKAISTTDALAELRRCAGTQFGPRVVEAFCTVASTHAVAA